MDASVWSEREIVGAEEKGRRQSHPLQATGDGRRPKETSAARFAVPGHGIDYFNRAQRTGGPPQAHHAHFAVVGSTVIA